MPKGIKKVILDEEKKPNANSTAVASALTPSSLAGNYVKPDNVAQGTAAKAVIDASVPQSGKADPTQVIEDANWGFGTQAGGGSGTTTPQNDSLPADAIYHAKDWNDEYRNGIDTSYYDKAYQNYINLAEKQRANQLAQAEKTQQSALRQAYIQKMQNDKGLSDALATSGIRGGATETSRIKLMNQYGQERANANTNYANSVNEINQSVDKNIADFGMDIEARKEEYTQNLSQLRWQAENEGNLQTYNSANETWSNYYTNYFSSYTNAQLDSAEKEMQRALNSATTMEDKIRYTQALSAINAQRGNLRSTELANAPELYGQMYMNYYSSWSNMDKLRDRRNEINKLLKDTSLDDLTKIQLQQELNGITARMGDIKAQEQEKQAQYDTPEYWYNYYTSSYGAYSDISKGSYLRKQLDSVKKKINSGKYKGTELMKLQQRKAAISDRINYLEQRAYETKQNK